MTYALVEHKEWWTHKARAITSGAQAQVNRESGTFSKGVCTCNPSLGSGWWGQKRSGDVNVFDSDEVRILSN